MVKITPAPYNVQVIQLKKALNDKETGPGWETSPSVATDKKKQKSTIVTNNKVSLIHVSKQK